MEIYIVQLFYLLRPMLNAELVQWGILGFNFFELVAILLFLALAAAFAIKILQKSREAVSHVEVWAALLIGWITISYIVHIEISSMTTYAKFVMPLATYILLKRILPDRSTHVRMIFLMLVGFLFPFIMSAIMTYRGEGIAQVVYHTGFERYKGAYANIHSMGHNTGFAIMATFVYVALRKSQKVALRWSEIIVLSIIVSIGIYLLYAGQVRTAILGLVAFLVIASYFFDKRVLALLIVLSIALVAYFWSDVRMMFYDIINPEDWGRDPEAVASGRKMMWTWALEFWREAPLLYQLTGMGVTVSGLPPLRQPLFGTFVDGTIRPWPDPHNDWLYVLLSLGLIGLAIFIGLFASILRGILGIPGKEKFALLGLFVAIVIMVGASNSYISNFTMFQMFLMLMVYVDLKSTEVEKKSQTKN